jgi:hypothetical protein
MSHLAQLIKYCPDNYVEFSKFYYSQYLCQVHSSILFYTQPHQNNYAENLIFRLTLTFVYVMPLKLNFSVNLIAGRLVYKSKQKSKKYLKNNNHLYLLT